MASDWDPCSRFTNHSSGVAKWGLGPAYRSLYSSRELQYHQNEVDLIDTPSCRLLLVVHQECCSGHLYIPAFRSLELLQLLYLVDGKVYKYVYCVRTWGRWCLCCSTSSATAVQVISETSSSIAPKSLNFSLLSFWRIYVSICVYFKTLPRHSL